MNHAIPIEAFDEAAAIIYAALTPSPQIHWPLLSERCGTEVWVKHENTLPTGAFKVRGGLVFAQHLAQTGGAAGVIAATRGNHGQSVAFAARRHGIDAVVVVPENNNPDKNRAMRAFGAELIEHGRDFDAAYEYAIALGEERGLTLFPSFHPLLLRGVGTYAVELFRAVADLDTVYVPIGLGSGICGLIAARDALRLQTRIVGVVSANADSYARSFAAREVRTTASADTMADGLAVRTPNELALSILLAGAERIVTVTDDEVMHAMSAYFSDTHNIAEGAGAAPLAALLNERERYRGERVGLILSGGNIDAQSYARILERT
ncbi:MAG: threonine dehydratase [Gammaproteobacteria bacterium]